MKLGIDIGGTNIRVAQVNETGIVNLIKESCDADKPEKVVMDHLKDMIQRLITPEISGIGIGVPSLVDVEKGIVYNLNNIPSWKEVHIKDELEKEFSVPTHVNNDANCFALGHKNYGLGKTCKDIVCVAMGTGLGSGIIVNNELYMGANNSVGEIGCVAYKDSIYEGYCSSHYFKRFHNTTSFDLYNRAEDGDPEALKIWDSFGKNVSDLIKMILFTYDPEMVIFGGSVSKAFKFFSDSMHKNLQDFLFPKSIEKLKINVSEIPNISVLGAASLVKEKVLKKDYLI